MRISARTEYALRAVALIAAAGDQHVSVRAICRSLEVPYAFVSEALAAVRKGGYLQTLRGPGGGYRLAAPADEISVADVVRCVEPELLDVTRHCTDRADGCAAVTTIWIAASRGAHDVLDGIMVSDLATGELPTWVSAMAGPAAVG